jgi:ribosomal protein S18 acetylase RimI-like enzyme
MKLTLRSIIDTDFQEIVTWVPDLEASQRWGGPMMVYPLTPEILIGLINPKVVRTFVMVDEADAVMGVGQIYFKEPSRFHLARIMVDPAARGQGHGRKLVEMLMNRSWIVPDRYFTLNVNFKNKRAQNLYESLGFVVSPAEEGSFSETSYFMKKVES